MNILQPREVLSMDGPSYENVFEHFWGESGLQKAYYDAGIDVWLSELTWSSIFTTLFIAASPFLALLVLAFTQRDIRPPPPAGCRKLGLVGRSNLEDQYSKKYARGAEPTPAKPWTVKALFIYPLKSCAPVELDKSDIIRTGLKYDRQFTLGHYVTSLPSPDGKVTSEWHFMTQRKYPRLANVETEIWIPDEKVSGYKADGEWVKSEGCLIVRFPFSPDTDFTVGGLRNYGKILAAKLARQKEPMLEFRVPFNPSKDRIKSKGYKNEVLRIWKDNPVALNIGPEIDREVLAKLQYTLGTTNPITLFRIDTNQYREVHKCAPKKEDVGFQTVIGMQDSVRQAHLSHTIFKALSQYYMKLYRRLLIHNLVSCSHHKPSIRPRRRRTPPRQRQKRTHMEKPLHAPRRPALPSKHLHHWAPCLPRRRLGQSIHRPNQVSLLVPHDSLQTAECRPCHGNCGP